MSEYEIDPITGRRKRPSLPGDWRQNLQSFGGVPRFDAQTAEAPDDPLAPNTTVGGYTPDYVKELENEPGYLGIDSSLDAASITDRASRDAAIRQALAMWGEIPAEWGAVAGISADELNGIVDQQTRDTAAANTAAGLSQKARLDEIAKRNLESIRRRMAAQGGLRSGGTRRALEDETLADRQRRSEAVSKLTQFLTGAALAYARSEDSRSRERAQAMIEARDRLINDPTKQPTEGRKVVEFRPGVWFDPERRTFVDGNGNPISDPYGVDPGSGERAKRGSGSREYKTL